MAMSLNGLAKLAEELGELQQVVGKKLAYLDTDNHPDGGESLQVRLEEEIGDVLASIKFVTEKLNLDNEYIWERSERKLGRFKEWDKTNHGRDKVHGENQG